jgi:ribonuclease VapC
VSSRIDYILDSSALLAVIADEPGQEQVRPLMNHAAITAVNACEVVSKLISRDVAPDEAIAAVVEMDIHIATFDDRLAFEAATILPATRSLGLSLGDRACLAYARLNGTSVLTADKVWKKLAAKLGIDIRVIR